MVGLIIGVVGALVGFGASEGLRRSHRRGTAHGRDRESRGRPVVGLEEAERIAQQGSWMWELHTDVILWSRQMYVLLGEDPDSFEPTLRRYVEAIVPDDRWAVWRAVERAVRDGTPSMVRYRMHRGDGEVRLFESRGRVIETADDGAPRRLAGTCRDVTEDHDRITELARQRQRLRTLTRRLTAVQEQERRRVALALHDDVGQIVTALELQLAHHASVCDGPSLEGVAGELRRLHVRVRNLSIELRPHMLDDLGLAHAVRWLVERADEQTATTVVLEADGLGRQRHSVELETAAFRIVQEALTNAMRHAEARRVAIVLDDDGSRLRVEVGDDGAGFDPALVAETASGISGMHERAEAIDGSLEVRSQRGGGTTVVARLPTAVERPSPSASGS